MADVKAIAEELVNLTVKEVSELKTILHSTLFSRAQVLLSFRL